MRTMTVDYIITSSQCPPRTVPGLLLGIEPEGRRLVSSCDKPTAATSYLYKLEEMYPFCQFILNFSSPPSLSPALGHFLCCIIINRIIIIAILCGPLRWRGFPGKLDAQGDWNNRKECAHLHSNMKGPSCRNLCPALVLKMGRCW